VTGPATVAHWRELPLGPGGRALVEASAGTGKTWTIGVLWWRLLLEPTEPLSVQQIVVTTFTDAAAQELRERLRQRLHQALALAAERPAPEAAKGEDEAWLLSRWTNDDATHAEDLRRLRLALADFDRAPIRTLHGLCQGILAEHPLESGHGTEPAEPTSGAALLDELARDAWRVLRQSDDDALARAGREDLKLSTFSATLRSLLRPGVRLEAGPDLAGLRAGVPEGWEASLLGLLSSPGLFQPRKSALRNALQGLAEMLRGEKDALPPANTSNLRAFDVEDQVVAERVAEFRSHPAIVAAQDLFARVELLASRPQRLFWIEQLARVTAWRDQRLAARGQTTFDEMIRQAHAAVTARPALADALFEDWPVALVDEFQDTDDQQYGILDRLYRDADGQPRGRLVMIGDPKQAIYGFRGGDVHAYLRARADAAHRLSLDTNHRSSPALVGAVNGLYAAAGEALDASGEGAIRYEAVQPSDRQAQTPWLVGGQPVAAPLVLHLWRDAPVEQPARRRAALDACAAHIASLLADPAQTIDRRRAGTIVRERLAPGDIAVLLPTNNDIQQLRAALLRLNVPCVGGARASVFDSDWAFELQVLLQALASPGDEGVLRAAVLTRLWGGTLAQVAALAAGEDAGDGIGERLQQLRALWRHEGVLAVVLALAEAAAPRLLAHPGGDRDLTDLRHLGELLQQQADAGLGPHALLAWLAEQRLEEDGEAPDSEERQLRIESDARRVQLMTLHRAKGLEFPVVFLPLMWNHAWVGSQGQAPWLLPADGRPGREARFDAPAQERARCEAQDERFRVLYVALTRAIHACHVYALSPDRPKDKQSSAPRTDPERSPLDAMLARLGVPATIPALPGVQWLEGWPAEAPPLPRDGGDGARREALPMPPPARLRQRLSFSALVGGARRSAEEEAPADDEAEPLAPGPVEEIDDSPHPALLALAAVRGPAFGNAVHLAFETRDHDKSFVQQPGLLARQLAQHGVRASGEPLEALVPRLAAQLDAALQAELLPGLRLGDVPASSQRAEMAFHFKLDGARLDALRQACAAHGEPGLVPPLAWGELRGLMTGKIDLVFEHAGRVHVLDYKGNWLGERLADYRGEALVQAMDQHHYRLQALLYTVAVHRYLGQRLAGYSPERHLGEAIYLFVRAAGHGPGAGVWTQAFDPALVRAVDDVFATTEAAP
jgi:exodeoxyribonuclease V beta subunit